MVISDKCYISHFSVHATQNYLLKSKHREFPGALLVKDPALSLLWLSPWLGNFYMPQVPSKKKKKKVMKLGTEMEQYSLMGWEDFPP